MGSVREVTLKLTVLSVGEGKDQVRVEFYADYADERNKEWAAATPSARLEMVVRSEVAREHFAAGRNFLVTLTPEDPAPMKGEVP